MRLTSILGVSACCAGLICAQDSHTLADALVRHYQASKALTVAVADAMPAENYGFRATDGEMSFGEQMNHIMRAGAYFCSAGLDTKPVAIIEDTSKAAVMKNLNTVYDFCLDGMKKVNDGQLMKAGASGAPLPTAFELFWFGFTHIAHHRGQTEVYLRLKGITPPPYNF